MADGSWDGAMARLTAAQRDFANGDASGLKRLYSHCDDVTVFGGFGGLERGWTEVGPRVEWAASHFSNGTYRQQDLSATVGTDVACLVSLEHWSYTDAHSHAQTVLDLRVTQLFRREDGEWRLVHRHADPLMQKRAEC